MPVTWRTWLSNYREMTLGEAVDAVNQLLRSWVDDKPLAVVQFNPNNKGYWGFRPAYIIRAMNTVFGPAGQGWGYDVLDRDQRNPFVSAWVKEPASGERISGPPQYGDDIMGPKGTLTNAMGKALSLLGIGEAAYLGLIDGDTKKYTGSNGKPAFDVKDAWINPAPGDNTKPRSDATYAADVIGQDDANEVPEDDCTFAQSQDPDALMRDIMATFEGSVSNYMKSYRSHADAKTLRRDLRLALMSQRVLPIAKRIGLKLVQTNMSLMPEAIECTGYNGSPIDLRQVGAHDLSAILKELHESEEQRRIER